MRVICFLLILIGLDANAETFSPSQVAVVKYFDFFNGSDRDALNKATSSPFVLNIAGVTTSYEKYGDAVDFDGLRKTGWSYSRIRKNESIYEDETTAMVGINFTRYTEAGDVLSISAVVYVLVMEEGQWKLKAGFVNGNLSLGK